MGCFEIGLMMFVRYDDIMSKDRRFGSCPGLESVLYTCHKPAFYLLYFNIDKIPKSAIKKWANRSLMQYNMLQSHCPSSMRILVTSSSRFPPPSSP